MNCWTLTWSLAPTHATLAHTYRFEFEKKHQIQGNFPVILQRTRALSTHSKCITTLFSLNPVFPNRVTYSLCMSCSSCKMVSLGQQLKTPKTCGNPSYKNFRVVLPKKLSEKKNQYWRNETILKIGHLAKAIAHAKAIAFAKWSVWVKT